MQVPALVPQAPPPPEHGNLHHHLVSTSTAPQSRLPRFSCGARFHTVTFTRHRQSTWPPRLAFWILLWFLGVLSSLVDAIKASSAWSRCHVSCPSHAAHTRMPCSIKSASSISRTPLARWPFPTSVLLCHEFGALLHQSHPCHPC